MKTKMVFLDIDGTLLHRDGKISFKSRYAVRKARANGHYVCIATGRCGAEISEEIRAVGFDGIICAAGAQIIWKGMTLREKFLDNDQVKAVTKLLQQGGGFYILEGPDSLYVRSSMWKELLGKADLGEKQAEWFVKAFTPLVALWERQEDVGSVNKIAYFNTAYSTKELSERLKEQKLRATSFVHDMDEGESGEITRVECNKGESLCYLAESLGFTAADAIAIGDSENDLDMLKAAGCGIAMGNAPEKVKKAADEVTACVWEEGVYQAFLRHGLITPLLKEEPEI